MIRNLPNRGNNNLLCAVQWWNVLGGLQETIKTLKADMDTKLTILSICSTASGSSSASVSDVQQETAQILSLVQQLLDRVPTPQRTTKLAQHMQQNFVNVVSAVTVPNHTAQDVADALSDYKVSEAELSDEEQAHIGELAVGVLQSSNQPHVKMTAKSLMETGAGLQHGAMVLQKEAWRDLEGVVQRLVSDRHPKVASVMAEQELLRVVTQSEARLVTVRLLLLFSVLCTTCSRQHSELDTMVAVLTCAGSSAGP